MQSWGYGPSLLGGALVWGGLRSEGIREVTRKRVVVAVLSGAALVNGHESQLVLDHPFVDGATFGGYEL